MSAAKENVSKRFEEKLKAQPVKEDGSTLEMRVGERLHVELLTTGERFWAELVGDKQGKFLLLSLPSFSKLRKDLASETMVAVRGLNSDYQLCGFRTTISRLLTVPCPLLFLDYPSTYEKLSLRRHERVDCLFPALLLHAGEEYKTMVTNLSTGGAGVVLNLEGKHPEDLTAKAEVFLLFKSFKDGSEAVVRAEVRNVRTLEGKMTLGLEFDSLIGDSLQIIEEYVNNVKQYGAVQ